MVPLYIMSIIGYTSRKMRIFNSHVNQVITQLMLYITLPALILFSLNIPFTTELFIDFTWLVFMSLFVLGISIFIGALLRKKSVLPKKQKSVYESLIIFGNQGFIGLAISYIVMAEQGIIYVTLFNICYLILIWTYGIFLFTKKEHVMNWKGLFFNPGILSTLIGLFMLFMPFSWPYLLSETFEEIGMMTIPLSMLLIGSLLADLKWSDFQRYLNSTYIWIAAGFKLLILPLFLLFFLFLRVPFSLIVIAVLTSAMPSAPTTTVYAQKFGADPAFASFGVLLTTLLSILTIPILFSLLQLLHSYFY